MRWLWLPNKHGATTSQGATTINFGLPNDITTDNAPGKLDYRMNAWHTLNGLYFVGKDNGTVSDASQLRAAWLTQIHTRARVIGLNWTWIPSTNWINEARFG